jgi:hypothetical protein
VAPVAPVVPVAPVAAEPPVAPVLPPSSSSLQPRRLSATALEASMAPPVTTLRRLKRLLMVRCQ